MGIHHMSSIADLAQFNSILANQLCYLGGKFLCSYPKDFIRYIFEIYDSLSMDPYGLYEKNQNTTKV